MSQTLQNRQFTVGDTLIAIWAQLEDADGTPRDISADSISFQLTSDADSSEKIVAGSESGTVSNKQIGNGVSTISAATQAFPPVITTDTHGLTAGDVVLIHSMVGMTELNDKYWEVGTVGSTTTFEVNHLAGGPVIGNQFSAYTSGGYVDSRGLVSYAWHANDVDTAGIYWGQFIRTNTAQTEHHPIGKRLRIEFVDPARDA